MRKKFKEILFYMPLAIAFIGMIDVVVYWDDSNLRYLSLMAAMGWLFHFDSECALRRAEEEIDELLGHTDVQS